MLMQEVKVLKMTMENKIWELINEKERIRKIMEDEESPIDSLRITQGALEKLNMYARIASEIAGDAIECRGFLLNQTNKYDDIARDTYLEPSQMVTSVRARSEWGDERWEMRSIHEENKRVCGIWHSHGDMAGFHSEDDDRWLNNIYTTNRINKIQLGKFDCENLTTYEDGVLTIKFGDTLLTLKTKEKPELIKTEKVIERKFMNSLVTTEDLYISGKRERGRSYYCESLAEDKSGNKVKLKNLELEIVQEENGIVKGPKEIVKECGEKISYQGRLLKEHPNYESVLRKYTNLEGKIDENHYGYKQRLRNFYQNYKVVDETDSTIVNIAKILTGDFRADGKRVWKWEDRIKKIEEQQETIKKTTEETKEKLDHLYEILNSNTYLKRKHAEKIRRIRNDSYKNKVGSALVTGGIYACMGLLLFTMVACKGIEKASLHYLRKTRPDVASMMEEGRSLSEIAKVYYNKK